MMVGLVRLCLIHSSPPSSLINRAKEAARTTGMGYLVSQRARTRAWVLQHETSHGTVVTDMTTTMKRKKMVTKTRSPRTPSMTSTPSTLTEDGAITLSPVDSDAATTRLMRRTNNGSMKILESGAVSGRLTRRNQQKRRQEQTIKTWSEEEGCGLAPTIDDYKLALRAHGPLSVCIPDRLWQGYEDQTGTRNYIIDDVQLRSPHGDASNGLLWVAREVAPNGRPSRGKTGKWLVPTRLLMDPGTHITWNSKAYERMLLPERHHYASIRAEAIAGVLGTPIMHSDAYIVTLDTPGRNIEAMVKVGWSRERILVFEMRDTHVMYLRLTGRIPPENVIYTPDRWETYVLDTNNSAAIDRRLSKAVIFYADYYGSPTHDFHDALQRLPALQAYSVCGQPRRIKNKTTNPGGDVAFNTPLPGFKKTCTIYEGRMITNTFVHKRAIVYSPIRSG